MVTLMTMMDRGCFHTDTFVKMEELINYNSKFFCVLFF